MVDSTHIAKHLSELQEGFLPTEIFNQVARLVVLPFVELIIFSPLSDLSVLLTKREEGDKFWPGMWHVPGTVLRTTDLTKPGDNFDKAVYRILNEELGGQMVANLRFHSHFFHRITRGVGLSLVHYARAVNHPTVGQYFHVDQLPDNIVPEQRAFIQNVVRTKQPWEYNL